MTAHGAVGVLRPVCLAAALALSACAEQTVTHGQMFRENDLAQVQAGMTQDQVKLTLGTPTTTASLGGGNGYYYVSSKASGPYFLAPHETSRQVVAVYFTQAGIVERVANYGLKDGKVFDFISSSTPAADTRDDGILKQLFRNLGQKGAGSL